MDYATKADLEILRSEISIMDVDLRSELHKEIAGVIKWNVGTILAVAALAFAIAKWIH